MAKRAGVIFRFDKATDIIWLGMFGEDIKPQMKKEVGDIVITTVLVKEYSLTDHQFIQLKLDAHGSEIILQFPRSFVVAIVEGPNLEKLGF
jgi:hypothetical protein